MVRHVQDHHPSWHPLGRPASVDEDLVPRSAEGPNSPRDLAGRLLDLLDDRWVTGDGQPLNERGTLSALHRLEPVLVGLDQIRTNPGDAVSGRALRSGSG